MERWFDWLRGAWHFQILLPTDHLAPTVVLLGNVAVACSLDDAAFLWLATYCLHWTHAGLEHDLAETEADLGSVSPK